MNRTFRLTPAAPAADTDSPKPARRALSVLAASVIGVAALGAQGPGPLSIEQATEQAARGDELFAEAHFPEAYEAYHRALEAPAPDVVARSRKGKIRTAIRLARFQIARAEAEALKSAVPDDVDALTLYGDALWGQALFEEAEAAYRAALARYPTSSRAQFGVARSMATRGGREDALAQALKAASSAPPDPEVLVLVGELYERLYRFDEAADAYEKYIAELPPRLRGGNEVASLKVRFLRSFRGRPPVAIDGNPSALHTVPFTLRNRKIVVRGALNGRTVDFVLDTGAERTALTRDTAARADVRAVVETRITGVGTPGLRTLSVARADSVTIGSLTVRNVPVSIRRENMLGTEPWQNETFSPVPLGLSVVVDYGRREVSFGRQIPETPADFRLPLRVYRLPMVRGLLNDTHSAYFVVDTGGELVSISRDVALQLEMRPPRLIPIRVWGVTGIDPDAFLLPGVNLNFQDIALSKLGVAVLNLRAPSVLLGFQVGGILGHKFLGGYRVALDMNRAEMRLQKF
jgi:tetratricopeptide (TPR) repeat protein